MIGGARDAGGPDRIVAQTSVLGIVWVSTVFLGLDHNYARILDPTLPPLLFESMAFWRVPGGSDGYEQERCSTWIEAEAQHREMCRQVARPAAVLAWMARCWRGYWQAAAEAWRGKDGHPK